MRVTRVVTPFTLCLTLAPAGCSSFAERDACLDRPESLAYVAKLRQSIDREWERPTGVAGGLVLVTARVNRKGELRSVAVGVACDSRPRCRSAGDPLARSMNDALRRAKPIGPPPEGASCMLLRTVELSFESSDVYVPDPE